MDFLYSVLKRIPSVHVETEEGFKWGISEDLYVYHQVLSEYRFSDLGKDDLLIDIGANIGVFSILAARRGARVLAIEPVMGYELRRNIRLNRIQNIRLLECALGDGREMEVSWNNRVHRVPSMTLSQMVRELGGCTFLKVDCEGGEWYIDPEELKGIRRIEMELHRCGNFQKFPSFMEGVRQFFHIDYDPGTHPAILGIVHGYVLQD
jgi:hypothetical protein